jgi:hypothetical protein
MLHSSGGALGFSAATRSIVWNQIFASDPWKYREVGAVQNDERFHPRETPHRIGVAASLKSVVDFTHFDVSDTGSEGNIARFEEAA